VARSLPLTTWLKRSRPSTTALLRAFVLGALGALVNAGLLIGAVGLLVESSKRPGLAAVAVLLIVIEIFAFLRSPLRYVERTSSHRLGFEAVRRWRRWLLVSVGSWNFARWRSYASGDLLERALTDTDELQGLWLRGVLPFFQAVVVLLSSDVVLALLPTRTSLARDVVLLGLLQFLTCAVLLRELSPLHERDRVRREAKAHLQSVVVESSRSGPELFLMGSETLLAERLRVAVAHLEDCERILDRRSRLLRVVAPLSGLCSVLLLVPSVHAASVWTVVASLVCFASFDSFVQITACIQNTVHVLGAGARLDELSREVSAGSEPWPLDTTLELKDVTLSESGRVLLASSSLRVAPGQHLGITGVSGAGKSSLLRALSGLEAPTGGSITIGGVALTSLSEEALRRHLSYVPSAPGLVRGYVRDVLTMGRTITVDYSDLLEQLGLPLTPDTYLEGLSTGQTARVALARALATSPSIVLLDEPTAGLGDEETQFVLTTLRQVPATVIVVSHDPAVLEWCDEVVVLASAALR